MMRLNLSQVIASFRKNKLSNKLKKVLPNKKTLQTNVKALGIKNELNAFFQIIDMSMIDDVLRYKNMYIDQLRVDYQYSRYRDYKNANSLAQQRMQNFINKRIETLGKLGLDSVFIKLYNKMLMRQDRHGEHDAVGLSEATVHVITTLGSRQFGNFWRVIDKVNVNYGSTAPSVSGILERQCVGTL
ncbi:hypothetical protein FQA39_LY01028 [Lamprigera yunnana]|nr:hypothetical protein FQA39_LY01028 [Lamprigera yunnana]